MYLLSLFQTSKLEMRSFFVTMIKRKNLKNINVHQDPKKMQNTKNPLYTLK